MTEKERPALTPATARYALLDTLYEIGPVCGAAAYACLGPLARRPETLVGHVFGFAAFVLGVLALIPFVTGPYDDPAVAQIVARGVAAGEDPDAPLWTQLRRAAS